MTDTAPVTDESDQALVHDFIRVHGRRPDPQELEHYRDARSRAAAPLPNRARRAVARLNVRL